MEFDLAFSQNYFCDLPYLAQLNRIIGSNIYIYSLRIPQSNKTRLSSHGFYVIINRVHIFHQSFQKIQDTSVEYLFEMLV